jgi:hypothetical protein
MITSIIGTQPEVVKPQSPAARLSPAERKDLAVQVLDRTDPVTVLAEQNGVGRKFLYGQARKATEALEEALDPASNESESRVLFTIPVTKEWLRGVVLALVLIARSSIRGAGRFSASSSSSAAGVAPLPSSSSTVVKALFKTV